MDFERSTQAKSWLFSTATLAACRERASIVDNNLNWRNRIKNVRKFASGYHRTVLSDGQNRVLPCPSSFLLDPKDQECLVQFHAHQIQTLIGPTALLPDLRTSVTALSTAVTFFRRFYLSNSVLTINPRKMAVACAFFAAKAEEEKIEVRYHGFQTWSFILSVQKGSKILMWLPRVYPKYFSNG